MLKLKEIRLSRGLSAQQLSTLSGVPLRTIQDMEKRGCGRLDTADKLMKALDLTLNDIWEREEE